MKIPSLPNLLKSVKKQLKGMRLIVVLAIIAVLLVGTTSVVAYNKNAQKKKQIATEQLQKKPTKPAPRQEEKPAEVVAKATEAPAATSPTPTAKSKPAKAANTDPVPFTPIVTYYATRVSANNTLDGMSWCSGGALGYTVQGLIITSPLDTGIDFSWQIKANDGQIVISGTDTFPAGKHWIQYPYDLEGSPYSIVSLNDAHDGDSFQFIITSPDHSESLWTTPIPVGTEASCN